MTNFRDGIWMNKIDVRNFIQTNYTPYLGDESFLTKSTQRTITLLEKINALFQMEREKGGVLDIDISTASSLTNYFPGYIDKDLEIVVGLQTDMPLKRAVNPFGGIRMARTSCREYGYTLSQEVENEFRYVTTHNDGVFRVYTDEMRKARKSGVITGLPDSYGRGRIIGDYRRIPLYGVDFLIQCKKEDKHVIGANIMKSDNIQLSEEVYQQIQSLYMIKEMAQSYGFDISQPASNAREAFQWLYFGFLAAIKEQNGAAMSLGRVATFLDIYIERDIQDGIITEEGAQELVDDFVLKLRIARHLRTDEYNELFGGDPMWITESLGGMGLDSRTLVTKTTYRFLSTLYNLGSAPEPNLTILWSKDLPDAFKRYCAKVSVETDAIQYENDDLMRIEYGDDYGIACCVSAMKIGKQMQFFGARCNLPKLLLMTLNGGRDEITGIQIAPETESIQDDILDYGSVMNKFKMYRGWLCKLYVNTLNIIHYMHDKYAYEKMEMALHDTDVGRFMAFGIAGLSVLVDSLSAIKYAEVKPIRNTDGLIVDFEITGDFPKFGNDDDRVDTIAQDIVEEFIEELRKTETYRNAIHTLSVLTITSNVVYGKKTGSTPDGRKRGEPFAPGANPMHKRELNGGLASLNSVSKLNFEYCRDGISNTFTITPEGLGKTDKLQKENLVNILDGYFISNGHHLNVNVLNKETLMKAYEHPEQYPNLTVRVSGYAVNFTKLSREQQEEIMKRTFHKRV